MKQWVQHLFTKVPKDRSSEKRDIQLNDPRGSTQYCDNRIYSSKYNIFTFLPLNLFEQFHRPINIYFLTVAALQFIPSVAPVSPLTTIFPITTAFLINAVKEGIDDLRRHRQDLELNERVYQRVKPGTLEPEEVASANIHVGDVLILHPFEVVPSDVVILLTSHDGGSAYITTESLDGETGSKQRFALLHHIFKYTSYSTSPVASMGRLSGLDGSAASANSATYSAGRTEPAIGVKSTNKPLGNVRSCCATTEEHQLHCLRYAFSTRLVLSSEGPNSHLHSYHGAATIRVPQSLPKSWRDRAIPALHADGTRSDDGSAGSGTRIAACSGADPADTSLTVAVSQNMSAFASDMPVDEGFPLPLPMPMVSSLSLRRSAHSSPTILDNSYSGGGGEVIGNNDERSRLLAASASSPTRATPRSSPATRSAFDAASAATPAATIGSLEVFDGPEQTLSVNIDNVIYSSSRTGNTHFIIALVIFTGRETKMCMTRNLPPTKWATIDNLFNYLAMFIFVIQLILVATCAFFSCTRLSSHASLWYLGGNSDPVDFSEYFPIVPLRYLMMLSPMVPLSFKVMVEISKAYVSYVIRWDEDIKTSEESASVNNSALAEELGQVEYVLSDKTGTLTANMMTFSALATATDVVFSSTYDSIGTGGSSEGELPLREVGKAVKAALKSGSAEDYYLMLTMVLCNTIERTLPLRFNSPAHGGLSRSTRSSSVHSIISDTAAPSTSRWMSASPDEVALVDGADQCGFPLRRRSRTHATIGLWGDAEASLEVELVHTLPFSSDRGMMSVLLRCPDVPGMEGKVSAASSSLGGKGVAHSPTAAPGASFDSSGAQYVLLVKGADEKVLPRCTDSYSSTHLGDITNRLALFSRRGLRTLVYGYRVLSEDEAREALRRFEAVETSFAAVSTREAELQRIYALLEHDFTYCGITAVKDELQEGVSQTLAQLRHANIRVWMLTGDKTETAKQTAVACGLLTSEDRVITLTPPNEDVLTATEHLAYVSARLGEIAQLLAEEASLDCEMVTRWQKLREWSRRFFWRLSGMSDFVHEFAHPATCEQIRPVDHPLVRQPLSLIEAQYGPVSQPVLDMVPTVCGAARRRPGLYFGSAFTPADNYNTCGLKRGYCVALSGKTLRLLEAEDAGSNGHSAVVRLFNCCLLHARSVVCSRTAPSLKSFVVNMVKRSGHITLAIGDGGNDVPMLQAAHVGVGIKGLEGSQAKLAADFAIGQFRFLSKLILVHGHTAFQRTAMIVQQSFWKTVLIAWVQVLYNMSTDFSGVSYWDSLSLTLYNAIPTVPVTFLCVMDMPLSHWILRTTPQLYSMSQRGRYLSATTFYGYIARAFLHGTIIYYLSMGLQSGSGALVSNGWVLDRSGDFYAVYIAVVTIHTYTVLTESHAITIAHWFCFLFSVYSCFISFWLYARVPTSPNGTFSVLLTSPSFYLAYIGLTMAVCASLAIYALVKVLWFPDALQFQRLLMVHLGEKSWLRRSLPVRVLRIFFQDDNPSHFWKSISPYHALKYYPPPKLSFIVNEGVEEVAA